MGAGLDADSMTAYGAAEPTVDADGADRAVGALAVFGTGDDDQAAAEGGAVGPLPTAAVLTA